MRKLKPKKYNCLKCGRPIRQRGNCWPCNIKTKQVSQGKNYIDKRGYVVGDFDSKKQSLINWLEDQPELAEIKSEIINAINRKRHEFNFFTE